MALGWIVSGGARPLVRGIAPFWRILRFSTPLSLSLGRFDSQKLCAILKSRIAPPSPRALTLLILLCARLRAAVCADRIYMLASLLFITESR